MTAVIITGGIDLSVGSLMAICTVVCAMLLTVEGWHAGGADGPAHGLALVALIVGCRAGALRLRQCREAPRRGRTSRRDVALDRMRGVCIPLAVGGCAAPRCCSGFLLPQVHDQVRRARRPDRRALRRPAASARSTASLIVGGRLQPFIVTLAMMVTALGIARLTAGQNNAVLPVYTGTERRRRVRHAALAGLRHGADAGPLLHRRHRRSMAPVLRFTPFGRYVYAIGGNEEAARLSGIDVGKVKIVTYAISGPARRHRRGPLRRAIPAGQAGRRRRAGARRHRRGGHRRHQPDGRARRSWPAPSAAC